MRRPRRWIAARAPSGCPARSATCSPSSDISPVPSTGDFRCAPPRGEPAVTEIVMIEDEPGIGDFVKRGLGARGFQVSCALDGDSGLERALGERVALVLLDLM